MGGKALRPYETIINSGKLSPIGYFADGTCLLMMTTTGKVYGATNWRIIDVGDTGCHAIENIVSSKNIILISDKP